jgi:hypothetical protein
MSLSLQTVVGWISLAISFFFNNFGYFLLAALIVYVVANWSKLRAFWSILYAKNEKLMQPTFDKVENMLNKTKETNGNTN